MSEQPQAYCNGQPVKGEWRRKQVEIRAPRFDWIPRWFARFSWYWHSETVLSEAFELEEAPPAGSIVTVIYTTDFSPDV